MDDWVIELIRQVPSAAAVIGTVYLFLKWMGQDADRRANDAKEKAGEERAHQIQMNNLWATTIKNVLDQQEKNSLQTTSMIVDKLGALGKLIEESYEKLGITQELIDAVNKQKQELHRQHREGKE